MVHSNEQYVGTMGLKQIRGRPSDCALCMRWYIVVVETRRLHLIYILGKLGITTSMKPIALKIYLSVCALTILSHQDDDYFTGSMYRYLLQATAVYSLV